MITIFLLALAGALLAVIIRILWSGHIRKGEMRFDKKYFFQFLLSFLTTFATVFIVIVSMRNGVTLGLSLGFVFLNWLCFVVPTSGSDILWSGHESRHAWRKFFSDTFSILVTLLLIATIASLFV